MYRVEGLERKRHPSEWLRCTVKTCASMDLRVSAKSNEAKHEVVRAFLGEKVLIGFDN